MARKTTRGATPSPGRIRERHQNPRGSAQGRCSLPARNPTWCPEALAQAYELLNLLRPGLQSVRRLRACSLGRTTRVRPTHGDAPVSDGAVQTVRGASCPAVEVSGSAGHGHDAHPSQLRPLISADRERHRKRPNRQRPRRTSIHGARLVSAFGGGNRQARPRLSAAPKLTHMRI